MTNVHAGKCLLYGVALAGGIMTMPANAATLRPQTTLQTAMVRIADLFDGAGAGGDRVLGPAPTPGARLVVEAPQLAAIARQFDIDWQPVSSADRIILDRPGRMLARNVIVQALREALNSLGAPRDATMELVGFTAPMVAPDITVRTDVEQLDWDGDSERFTGMLAISGDNMAVQRLRVSGALQEMSELPVAAHRLPAGTVIQPGDLVVRHVRTALARGGVVQDVVQALGKTVQHIVAAGQPLPTNDITTSAVVLKGAKVTMQLQSPGLTLLAQGTALENGGLGDRIAVLNPTSRAVVIAEIIAGDRVRVTPGNLVTLQASANPAGDDRRTLP